ncbi:hypothetical protein ACWENR_00435 [Micromonospora sp. NPDC004336]
MSINRRALLKGLAAAPAVVTASNMANPRLASAAPEALPEIEAGNFRLIYRTTSNLGLRAPFAEAIDQIQVRGSLRWATVDEVLASANRTGTFPADTSNGDYTGGTPRYTGYIQGWV